MQMICIKCGKKTYAQPHNLRKNGTTEKNYMCFSCARKYKHFHGHYEKKTLEDLKYLAYLRTLRVINE
jgi:protein-arginine kinase activator protein McsA